LPAHDLDLLIDAARIAGRVATSFTGATAARWDKPDGQGPVTAADLAVNEMLTATLRTARPDYGWLSEETEDGAARLDAERVFIVDPIDGTRSFVEGSTTWAHSIAVAERGVVTAAVVFLPLRDKLYAAALGRGATLNGAPIKASGECTIEDMTVLAARPTMVADNWALAQVPTFKRSYRPSLAYRLSLVAEGRFDGMLTIRPTWEWDIAAGCLIVTEAGGDASDRTGAALVYNNADPRFDGIVAGSACGHAALVTALA